MASTFLNIKGPAVAGFSGEQLVSIRGIKTIRSASSTSATTLIQYEDGTTTTVTTAAQVNWDVLRQLTAAVKAATSRSWTNAVIYDVTLVKAPVSIINA